MVICIALVVRLAVMQQTADVPTARHLVGDAAAYYDWARRIAAGDWIGRETFYQAPLYPYLLAVWFRLAGDSVAGVRVLQATWGAAACGLLGWATGRMFGRRTGVVAAAMLALYGPAVFYDQIVQKASLDNLLVCLLVALMAAAGSRPAVGRFAALGALGGLLSLSRENALVWLPVIAAWAITATLPRSNDRCRREVVAPAVPREPRPPMARSRWYMAPVAYLTGVAIVLLPVGARNAAVGGAFALTTAQAGPNFYIGNHRGADGRYRPLVRGHETPAHERHDATALAERETGRALSPREVSRFWMHKAWVEIAADPDPWLRLMGYKLRLVMNRYEISDVESLRVYRDASPVLNALCVPWHFGMLVPLAGVGAAVGIRNWRRLWVLYAMIVSMALAVAAFYVLGRYRFPLVPLLIPFAAAGVVLLWDSLRAQHWLRLVWGCGLAIAVSIPVNWPMQDERRLDGLATMNAGAALAESGDLAGATALFRRAVTTNPQSPEAHNNLAQALALRGAFAEAVLHYRAALAEEPRLPGVQFNLGVGLEQLGRIEEAREAYRAAVAQDPQDRDARAALRRITQGEAVDE